MSVEQNAYQKFKNIVNTKYEFDRPDNRVKLINTMGILFKNDGQPWSDEQNNELMTCDYHILKNAALEICGEAINRDAINMLRFGKRGTMAREMYNILK